MKWQHHAVAALSGKGRCKALTTLVVSRVTTDKSWTEAPN